MLHDVDAACPNSKEIWKCVSVDALVRRSWCNHSEHAECREGGGGRGRGGGADRTGSTVNYHWALSELLSRVHVCVWGGGVLWVLKS